MKSTVAHKCGYGGFPDVCRIIVNWGGLELNAQGPINGYTALHDSIWHGHTETATVLVEAGAKTNLVAWDGLVPLTESQKYGFEDVEDLLDNATDPSNNISPDIDGIVRVMNVFGVIPGKMGDMESLVSSYAPNVRTEQGCLLFDFVTAQTPPGSGFPATMYLYEKWQTQADLETHVALQSTQDFTNSMQQLLVSSSTQYCNDVSL
ncbi:ankyrin 2,3/unc44 [Pelomyxa schiedti]|nr:ankyrin 2,3/unc44 [Pelomyxa schiedti]